MDGCAADDPGAVDQDVQTAEDVRGPPDQPPHRLLGAHVHRDEVHLAVRAEALLGLRTPLLAAGGDDDPCARLEQDPCRGLAAPRRPARYPRSPPPPGPFPIPSPPPGPSRPTPSSPANCGPFCASIRRWSSR